MKKLTDNDMKGSQLIKQSFVVYSVHVDADSDNIPLTKYGDIQLAACMP